MNLSVAHLCELFFSLCRRAVFFVDVAPHYASPFSFCAFCVFFCHYGNVLVICYVSWETNTLNTLMYAAWKWNLVVSNCMTAIAAGTCSSNLRGNVAMFVGRLQHWGEHNFRFDCKSFSRRIFSSNKMSLVFWRSCNVGWRMETLDHKITSNKTFFLQIFKNCKYLQCS